MRKLTGYIGAMIIVFALMGSILAGYALNINGSTAVINEYDHITDVSGLYSHSDEKSYIDYNPASNYIGYSTIGSYDNNNAGVAGTYTFKRIDGGTHTIVLEGADVTIDGVTETQTFDPVSYHLQFICNKFYCQYSPVTLANRLYAYNEDVATFYQKITLSINNNTVSYEAITTSNTTVSGTITTDGQHLVYYTGDDWDYIQFRLYGNPNITGDIPAYYSDEWPIYLGCQYSGKEVVFRNESGYVLNNNTDVSVNTLYSDTDVGYGVYHTDTIIPTGATGYESAIPRTVYYSGLLGIDYTESNRVNNYPISVSNSNITTANQIDLSGIAGILTNYAPADLQRNGRTLVVGRTADYIPEGNSLVTDVQWSWPCSYVVKNFLLSDIIATQSIPATTYKIRVDFNSNSYSNFDGNLWTGHINKNFDINTACLNKNNWYVDTISNYDTPNNKIMEVNDVYGEKEYGIINPDTGIIDIYNHLGVKIETRSIYNTYVTYLTHDTPVGAWRGLYWYSTSQGDYYHNDYVQTSPNIYVGGNTNIINITYYQTSSTPVYMDITKGVKIDYNNEFETTWNNDYENGDIQILFRSDSIGNDYNNTIETMNGDRITVNYTGSKYYVKLNNNDSVEIGNWRNIILDIDFINDKITVYPIKTFNSFSNVEIYNTPIYIGEITDTENTQLKWLPTTKSLMFSIYKTSVFMNTYGVVMVNPILNITDYFTDLNNFYELELSNFSIFGDSITVNGETYAVNGNNLIIGDETLIINDLSIIYADGHTYLKDSHVTVDIGEITDNTVSMAGAWYFETDLSKGHTAQKMVYDWDWSSFIFDNTEFCIIYIGLAVAGLLIARRYCNLSIIDYAIFILSIVIALSIQVIA